MKNFIEFEHLRKVKYMYIDTTDYLADALFAKHKIPIKFGSEYVKPGEKYLVVTCSIKKKFKHEFEAAMEELSNKMHLMGNTDYDTWCKELIEDIT